MIAGLLLAVGIAGLEPPVQDDLRCVAVFAMIAGEGEGAKLNDSEKAGVVGALMYYFGRIEGRHPGVNLQAGLLELLNSSDFVTQISSEAKRCGAEMEAKGKALVVIGDALKKLSRDEAALGK